MKCLLLFVGLWLGVCAGVLKAQQTVVAGLPLETCAAAPGVGPMVFYICGDGGWKTFSQKLCSAFGNNGYPVAALNAAKYFWSKKTPQQCATDALNVINYYGTLWNRKEIILVGYSFGADVLSFIVNRLPVSVSSRVRGVVLLSPSKSTDFEVHVSELLGMNRKNAYSIPEEINRMTGKALVFVFGEEERDFPLNKITVAYKTLRFPGGHHYDDSPEEVAQKILHLFSVSE